MTDQRVAVPSDPGRLDSRFETAELRRIAEMLREEMPHLRSYYQVKSLEVFGSYVRDDQGASSDLDLLVEFYEPPSMFQFVRLELHLSELLGVDVDLVAKDALKPNIGRRIREEAIPV